MIPFKELCSETAVANSSCRGLFSPPAAAGSEEGSGSRSPRNLMSKSQQQPELLPPPLSGWRAEALAAACRQQQLLKGTDFGPSGAASSTRAGPESL